MSSLFLLLAAPFALCASGPRITCVVDGDTFWLDGEKVRLADINAPETGGARCPEEARLGHAASRRLIALLNAGAFTLEAGARDRDRYGRLLRVAVQRGQSIGARLVAEGLAEPWRGRRSDWCASVLHPPEIGSGGNAVFVMAVERQRPAGSLRRVP